jgi:hypothetical protein
MAKDPRDKVGLNPTGRPTKSSAGKARQAEKRETGRQAMQNREGRRAS